MLSPSSLTASSTIVIFIFFFKLFVEFWQIKSFVIHIGKCRYNAGLSNKKVFELRL